MYIGIHVGMYVSLYVGIDADMHVCVLYVYAVLCCVEFL